MSGEIPTSAGGEAGGSPDRPYPGLRPFRLRDSPLFFGRSKERLKLLELIEDYPFLAVLGSSGSGKSSLVLSGLLPDIASGKMLADAPGDFAFTDFRPGGNPYGAFAEALWRGPLQGFFSDPMFIEERLRRSPAGLVQMLAEGAAGTLVVVVDQFEEFFRFAGLTGHGGGSPDALAQARDFLPVAGDLNEAQAFVDLLLASCRSTARRVLVVLTMRSDFYKHCEIFEGLPEMIAGHQYLAPRMSRRQLEDAIRLPLRAFNWGIEDELVNWMLNDVQGEYDQLPILQHSLSRMWSGAVKSDGARVLRLDHYQQAGKLSGALNRHGHALVEAAGLGRLSLARIFRALGDFDPATGAAIRRPRTLGQLALESGVEAAVVKGAAELFRGPEHCFLMPPPETPLGEKTVIDLTHECLLRKWEDLKGWMDAERSEGRALVRLAERGADLGWDGKDTSGGHLAKMEIQRFREAFPRKVAIPRGWGARYQADVEGLLKLLGSEERTSRRQLRRWIAAGVTTFVLVAGTGWWIQQARLDFEKALIRADQAEIKAKDLELRNDKALAENQKLLRERQETVSNEAIQATLRSQGENAARIAELERVLQDVAQYPADPEALRQELERLGISVRAPAAVGSGEVADFRIPQALAVGPHAKPVASVAFSGGGMDKLALLAGADQLRSKPLLGEATDASPGAVVWPQGARSMSGSGFADSEGWLAAANGGPDFAIRAEDGIWRTIRGGVPGVARVRWIGGKRVAIGTTDGRLGIWKYSPDGEPPRYFKTGHQGTINDVAANPSSGLLVSSGDDHQAILWRLNGDTPERLAPYACGAPVRSAAFSPDGAYLVLPSGEKSIRLVRLGDSKSGSAAVASLTHQRPVVGASFSPDGRRILAADTGGSVYIWSMAAAFAGKGNPDPESVVTGHRGRVTATGWSPSGTGFASADENGTVILWRLNAGTGGTMTPLAMPPHRGVVDALAWAPDGSGFATGGEDAYARVHPARQFIRGKFKTFGGPDHPGKDDLALVTAGDLKDEAFSPLFLRAGPAGASMIQRLDPAAPYIAARWDYGMTPKPFLRGLEVEVRNPKNGRVLMARPVDWGPAENSGKSADLSPGLASRLGLGPDDDVEIGVPLLMPAFR